MANEYYAPGEARAERVRDLFSAIAPRYDLINDLQSFGLHRLWKRRLARLARPGPGASALDVCCGTGDIAFALARQEASVVGLDFTGPMLRMAERRSEAQAGSRPAFVQGDAQQLPFPDNSFDIVTVGYGLRNLAGWERGLAEMWRVSRPGGRLLVLDFGKPEHPLWRRAYFMYLARCVPVFGRLFCGDAQAYAYILESLEHYPAQRGVARELERLGGAAVRVHELLGGIMSINYAEKPK
jgi:demethylmenaquinone methyltransferase/2-methoxy-6-polyprenyl-1,4-benzoquinol methylase